MTRAKPPTLRERANVQALSSALRRLDHAGIVTPCAGRDEWISERPKDVETAKRGCARCPIVMVCREAGAGQYAGVWGGRMHRKADADTDDIDERVSA